MLGVCDYDSLCLCLTSETEDAVVARFYVSENVTRAPEAPDSAQVFEWYFGLAPIFKHIVKIQYYSILIIFYSITLYFCITTCSGIVKVLLRLIRYTATAS